MHKEYHIDGVWYPSVTTILGDKPKPWLDKWRAKWGKRADQKMTAAANIGTSFHEGAEALSHNEDVMPLNQRLDGMLSRFEDWRLNVGFIPHATELHVVSNTYKYSGTFDAVGYLKPHSRTLSILDWKTSSAIYPDMALQLAAYAQAYKEQTGVQIKHGYIVHVSKDKPHHKLSVQEYMIGSRLINKFLKRRKAFAGVCPEHGETCMRRAA